MAVVIAAAPDALTLATDHVSITGDGASKRTLLAGDATDTEITNLVDDMDNISSAKIVKGNFGGRAITGMKASAQATSQNLISAWMQLNFTRVDPVNAAKTITKSWSLPAYNDSLRDTDNTPTVAAAGTGSAAARLGRIIAFLEDNLAFVGADGTTYSGGWTYAGGGFGTTGDVVDGE